MTDEAPLDVRCSGTAGNHRDVRRRDVRRNTPIVEPGPTPGLVALVKKRGEHRHVAQARNLAASIRRAADIADAGYPYRILGAHTVPRQWAVMVGGGCREVWRLDRRPVPTVEVWSRHGSWTMAPDQARELAATIMRTAGVDTPTTVRSGR